MVWNFISGLFGKSKVAPGETGEAVSGGQGQIKGELFPIIVPMSLSGTAWPGPIMALGDLPFALTWAEVDNNRFYYVTFTQQETWESQGIDWREEALDNLTSLTLRQPASGRKEDQDGKPFFLVMLHHDAMGPSRLLVPGLFNEILGADYLVALPEQTCAIAYRRNLTDDQRETVDAAINGCFENGTEPMSPERFEPSRFWVL